MMRLSGMSNLRLFWEIGRRDCRGSIWGIKLSVGILKEQVLNPMFKFKLFLVPVELTAEVIRFHPNANHCPLRRFSIPHLGAPFSRDFLTLAILTQGRSFYLSST